MTETTVHMAKLTDADNGQITLHRRFWEAGHRVFGLHGVTSDGHCACGDPTCKAVLKHPLVSNWQHTPNWSEEQLETMEEMGQFATGYGILLRGFLVIDVDARNGGLQSLQKLLEDIPALAGAGMIVNTGSGGGSRHYFFKVPEGLALCVKLAEYPGIDFKSGAHYVVGAGSLHASGNRYEVVVGSPDDIDDAPQELLEKLRKPERHRAEPGGQTVDVSHGDLADMVKHISGFDDYEYWIKVGMALHHASGGTAFDVWDAWSQQSSKYKAEEMARKWHSFGDSANPVTFGTLVHLAELGGWKQSVTFNDTTAWGEQVNWPEPEMRYLGSRGVPAPFLPLEDLVAAPLAAALRQVASAKGAPVDYVFAAFLTSVAAILSNHVVAVPRGGWVEPAVIWSMVVGEPSAGKSPALNAITTILKSIEREVNDAEQKAIREWEEEEKVFQSALKHWQKELDEAVKLGEPPPPMPTRAHTEKRPQRSRLMVMDITIERLAEVIGGQDVGLLQFRDELAGWLEGMVRYTKGGTDRGFWLEAYGGRPYTVDRMTRQVSVERLAVSVLGGIQPDRMNTLLLEADDDGLLARLMPIWPEAAPISTDDIDFDDGLLRLVLSSLYRYTASAVYMGKREPSAVRFHEEAYVKLTELRQRLRGMEGEEEGLTKSFMGKVPGLTVRVALALAYINAAARGADYPLELGETDFGAAQSFTMDYVVPMVRRSYEMASVSKAERAARKILWLAKMNGWKSFRAREIKRLGRTNLTDDRDIEAALSMLVAADWLREERGRKKAVGGRPTVTYHINPRLWAD